MTTTKLKTWDTWIEEQHKNKTITKIPVYYRRNPDIGAELIDGVFTLKKIRLNAIQESSHPEIKLQNLYEKLKQDLQKKAISLGGNVVYAFSISQDLELTNIDQETGLNPNVELPESKGRDDFESEKDFREYYGKKTKEEMVDIFVEANEAGRHMLMRNLWQTTQSEQKTVVYRAQGDVYNLLGLVKRHWVTAEKINQLRVVNKISQAELTRLFNELKIRDEEGKVSVVAQSKISDIESRGKEASPEIKKGLCEIFKLTEGSLD